MGIEDLTPILFKVENESPAKKSPELQNKNYEIK
jgi:hypothetical protein